MKKLLTAICLVSTLLFAGTVFAAQATSSFTVSANVAAGCTVSATNIAFGTYTGIDADSTNTVTVNCTTGTAYLISLSTGDHFSGTRRMSDGGTNYLGYNLYTDAGRTTMWGYQTVNGTGNGANQNYTDYGRVFTGQSVAAGTYGDNIGVLLDY
ncbi:MAG: spore coat U domain-containing protein [bacterium]|nr:spore coat U domain-containing protein [bacterium]